MKPIIAYALFSALLIVATATGTPWQTEGELSFWVDAVPFKGVGEKTGLQIVYRGGADQLTFQRQGNEYRAWACFSVEVRGSDGVTASKEWSTPVGAREESQTRNPDMYVVESLVADLPAGPAAISTSVRDSLSGRESTVVGEVEIPSYADSVLSVSGILFASRVAKGGNGPFQKGGFDILPEPSRRFGPFQPVLYVYHETYNLSCSDSAAAPDSSLRGYFSVGYSVVSAGGETVKVLPADTLTVPGRHAARVAGLSVAGLVAGEYALRVSVADMATDARATEEMPFWVAERRAVGLPEATARGGGGPGLSEEDAELLEALVTYLGNGDERSLYKGLSASARGSFLREFSARRTTAQWPTPEAYVEEHRRRLQHVNARFGGFQRGWKSDPGRVYIVYGPPDEIERYAAQTDRKDHQIWRYYSMGGDEFIFVDDSGYGNYRLVHSTAKGELRSPDWQKEVFILPTW